MKYSQFGAILLTRISSSGENSVAPLCGLTETAVWAPLFASKENSFWYISTLGKVLQRCYYTRKTYKCEHIARILDMCSILEYIVSD